MSMCQHSVHTKHCLHTHQCSTHKLTLSHACYLYMQVDIWSVGVIYFQMLYGARPFGEGQDQQKLIADQALLTAQPVDFPAKPLVSAEAKSFMRACLTPNQDERPDIKALLLHPYMRRK
jgi:tousled-like kinase